MRCGFEMQIVHRDSGNRSVCMAARADRRYHINPLHELSAKQPPIAVDVRRHNNLYLFGTGFRHPLFPSLHGISPFILPRIFHAGKPGINRILQKDADKEVF